MKQETINTLTELRDFIGNIVAGTQDCEDSSGDKERIENIDKCIQWLVSDGDLAIVSDRREQLISFAQWLAEEEEYGKVGSVGWVDAYLSRDKLLLTPMYGESKQMKTTKVTDMKKKFNEARDSLYILLSTVRCWWRANMNNYSYWRVTYGDGKRTRLLHKAEATGQRDVFGGRMWIDYKHCR